MMNDNDIIKIIESAAMIVCGYAFQQMSDGNIRIVGLKYPNHASVIRPNGEILETNMDDVEVDIVLGYWKHNQKYMKEEEYAEVL